jgi:hypothetical protein
MSGSSHRKLKHYASRKHPKIIPLQQGDITNNKIDTSNN